MEKQIGSFEAKTRFGDLLDRVERGEEITITRRGRPVARLVPISEDTPANALRAVDELRGLRKGCRLGGLSWRSLRDEGRK
jgi:prevent-host-death family protein